MQEYSTEKDTRRRHEAKPSGLEPRSEPRGVWRPVGSEQNAGPSELSALAARELTHPRQTDIVGSFRLVGGHLSIAPRRAFAVSAFPRVVHGEQPQQSP